MSDEELIEALEDIATGMNNEYEQNIVREAIERLSRG